ncbi:hypothetical protein BU23DRAFT_566314 [Bimuria novae-zelandiae CBS 107.79]|uniref:Uncharacterized protein n=1 Tax=Bimuria novae-zelandiae CBS 107.79 TaxID=1447943 RepID=A0A6A5VFU9_9PLEO|nr:hypothetical protein BU23DRAFT_566314 [Bimuria novae-zelandiae CBS 107.79]
MPDSESEWTLSKGATSIFWSIVWPFTCLVVVSFPNHINRWLDFSMVLAAGYCSWQTATDLSPDGTLNEMYVRYILIGGSHALAMAYKNPCTDTVPNHTFSSLAQLKTVMLAGIFFNFLRCIDNFVQICNANNSGSLNLHTYDPLGIPGIEAGKQFSTSEELAPSGRIRTSDQPFSDVKNSDTELLTTRHNLTARGKWAGIAIRCGYLLLHFFLLAAYYEFMDPQMLLSVPPAQLATSKSSLVDGAPSGPSDFTRENEGIVRRLLQTMVGRTPPATPVTTREFQLRALEAFDNVARDFLL